MSNLPEITTVRREGREPAGKSTTLETSSGAYPRGFATALAEVFAAGVTARKLLWPIRPFECRPCTNLGGT